MKNFTYLTLIYKTKMGTVLTINGNGLGGSKMEALIVTGILVFTWIMTGVMAVVIEDYWRK